jgi:hypothetical protein
MSHPQTNFIEQIKDNEVGHQSWTKDNLWVPSYHEKILYFTTRWDALCPYIDVTEEMLAMAPKPFVVYAIPSSSEFGVPINDRYGLVDTQSDEFWDSPLRIRKFRELDKQFKNFHYSEKVIDGISLTIENLYNLGGDHFANYFIDPKEVAGFIDYVRDLKVLIIEVFSNTGDKVLSDVSIILKEQNQLYGSFCQWNRAYKNRSPGIYACLLAARWAKYHGFRFYNLGPVDDYSYKSLFITDYEPIYGIALTDVNHPILLDKTSPLHVDFTEDQVNRIYRNK